MTQTFNVSNLAELKAALAASASDNQADIINITADISAAGTGDFTAGGLDAFGALARINITDGQTLQIVGGGHTLDANDYGRVLEVDAGTVTISNLVIREGLVSGAGGGWGSAGQDGLGGGIRNAGDLTLSGVTLTSNAAAGGGGGGGTSSYGSYGAGGGGGGGVAGHGGGAGGVGGSAQVPLAIPGAAGGGGSGGAGGGYQAMGGRGGSATGGAGGFDAAFGYASGGGGGTALSGSLSIGGGGGGAAWGGPGGAGGSAVGGIYNSGQLTILSSTVSGNVGAGGGGGSGGPSGNGYAATGGVGGRGVGGIWNAASGVLKLDTASNASLGSNGGASGAGGVGAPDGGAPSGTTAVYSLGQTFVNTPHTGGVSIGGVATQGQTLTAGSTLADADGMGTLHYQWLSNGSAVGADAATYTLAAGDVGHTLTVTASYTDGAGFAESATSSATAAVLSSAPAAPSAPDLTAASDTGASSSDNLTSAATVAFSGTGPAGDSTSTVQVFIDANNNGAYDAGTDISGTATLNNGAWTVSGLSTGGLSGGYKAYAQISNGDGTSPLSAALDFTVDHAAPTLAISSDRSALAAGETATVTFTFSEDPGATFTSADVTVSGGTLGTLSGSGATRTTTFTPTAGTNAGTASITVAAGSYADAAGNAGGAGATPSVHFDTLAPDAPSAPVLAPASDTGTSSSDNLTRLATPTFAGTAEAGATVKLYDGAAQVGAGTADGAGAWSITVASGLSEGSHALTAVAADAAGNVSAASAPVTVIIDATAPTNTVVAAAFSADTGASASDFITTAAAQTLSGLLASNLAAGETVEVSTDNGASWRSATATVGANTWSDAATLTHSDTLKVRVVDAAGNAGATYAQAYVLDTVAPAAPSAPDLASGSDSGVSSSDDVTSRTTPTVTGTAEAGATVTLYDTDGTTVLGATTATGGAWSITASALSAGDHVLTARATDAAGNLSPAGSGLAVRIDTSAPSLAITSDHATLRAGETATITFTFDEDPGSTFTWDGSSGDVVVSGGTLSALSGSGAIRTATFTPAADVNAGTASVTVPAGSYSDAAGNAGGAGASPSLTFDTHAPTLSIASDHASLKIGETATITFTFSEDPGASFTSADVTVSGGTLGALSGSGTTRTAVFTPTSHVDAGTASITVAAGAYADAAGNAGGAGTSPSLSFDTAAPTVSVTSDLASLHAGQTATITFTFSEDPGATFAWDGASGDVVVSGGALSALAGTGSTRTAVFTPDDQSDDGSGSVTVTAGSYADAAGNAGGAGATPSLVFDTLAPHAPLGLGLAAGSDTGVSGADRLTNLAAPTLTGTAEAGAGIRLYDTDGTTVLGSGTADGAGHWSITSTALADGAHDLSATATDAAGNVSASSAPLTVTVDTTAPAAPSAPDLAAASDTGASNTDDITTNTHPTFTGAAYAGAVVNLYDGAALVGAATADSAGFWSIASSTLGLGSHAMTARTLDAAGNLSVASAGLTVTIQSAAPPPVGGGGGGPPPVVVTVLEGGSSMSGNAEDNLITSSGGADTVSAGAGNDSVVAGVHDDVLQGNAGADTLAGGAGRDILYGGQDNDTVQGNTGEDMVFGDRGNDQVLGGQGADTVQGGQGDDYVSGDLGDDIVHGGQGDDRVLGGDGDDYLSGDLGSDTLTGGAGADTFHGFAGGGVDVVTDFNAAEGDRIVLDPGAAYTLTQMGADLHVVMAGGELVLVGVQQASLSGDWIMA